MNLFAQGWKRTAGFAAWRPRKRRDMPAGKKPRLFLVGGTSLYLIGRLADPFSLAAGTSAGSGKAFSFVKGESAGKTSGGRDDQPLFSRRQRTGNMGEVVVDLLFGDAEKL